MLYQPFYQNHPTIFLPVPAPETTFIKHLLFKPLLNTIMLLRRYSIILILTTTSAVFSKMLKMDFEK